MVARQQGCLPAMLVIAAALSIQDPRERPAGKEQDADQAHAVFKDPASDFETFTRIEGDTGRIVIEALASEGRLRVSVSDDGPGFPQELLQSGIRAFATHRVEGTGLGLSMVERFARSLGGSMKISNLEPHGACVTLDLPCRKEEHV